MKGRSNMTSTPLELFFWQSLTLSLVPAIAFSIIVSYIVCPKFFLHICDIPYYFSTILSMSFVHLFAYCLLLLYLWYIIWLKFLPVWFWLCSRWNYSLYCLQDFLYDMLVCERKVFTYNNSDYRLAFFWVTSMEVIGSSQGFQVAVAWFPIVT